MVSSPSSDELAAYFDRLSQLLKDEEVADQARTAALATRCSFEELAQRGLACNGPSLADPLASAAAPKLTGSHSVAR
jgi:hypothetical protein